MAMEITNNFGSVYENIYAAQKQQDTSKTETKETAVVQQKSGGTTNNSEYLGKLAKLAPSVEFRMGNTFSTAKSGKTLTINPALLEKMQNDPEQEKETMEMIKGVELITKFMDGIYKASGKTVVFRHSYIDENGKYRAYSCVKSDDRMSKKLRAERRKNSEKFMEKIKQKSAKRRKELQETLEEKIAASKDGRIYMDDAEFRKIMEVVKGDNAEETGTKKQPVIGVNLDLQV